jgi:predicted PolB exonuclease-like 3'-5' exonuclease
MLLDRPVVAFDIETVPDPGMGRRVLGLEGTDAEVVREMMRRRSMETEGRSEYPQEPWHKVVAVCATILDPAEGTVQIRALGDDLSDERSLLRGFFALVTRELKAPRLTSWNGSGFDLPVIRYRSMLHGISAPSFYKSDGDWKWNNYHNRFHDMHLDLMDTLSGYGRARYVGLGMWSQTLGSTGKSFLTAEVYEHMLLEELPLVIDYCKLDTVETMLAFLAWAHHVGDLVTADMLKHVDALRAAVAQLPSEGWRRVETVLAEWPAWAKRV